MSTVCEVCSSGVWDYMLEYVRNISAKLVDQKLYVMFGPVFDYDSDGRVDTDLTKARCKHYTCVHHGLSRVFMP